MRDGVSMSKQAKIKQAITATDIMTLKSLEAFVKYADYNPAKLTMRFQNIANCQPHFIDRGDL